MKIKLPLKDLPEKINLVIDSTGIKVYGEGEWKVSTHGWSKRRTWRKLHLAIEPESGQIVGVEATRNGVDDAEKVKDLIGPVPAGVKVEEVAADGAYDKKKTYDALNKHGTRAIIPPRKNAKLWQHGNSKQERLIRDENLRRIRKLGRAAWKKESNYHQRSLAETGVFRFKQTFGVTVSSRIEENQYQELKLKGKIMNIITHLGVPKCEKVTKVTL